MSWIIFYVLPLVLTYIMPFWLARNRATEGTTIGDLIDEFADVINNACPFTLFVLFTFLPIVNIVTCMVSMFICLYAAIKDIKIK